MDWKEVEFSGSDSFARVQMLQALCGPPPKRVDALLLIGGVDSFHSTLSQAALKFLFLGSSGQELLGEQVITQQHERLEDVVLLLTAHRAVIFYSSESDAAVKILPMIARWRHVQEVTFHDAMDPDEQEARKIHAFRDMVAGIGRIGIPYGVDPREPLRDLQDTMVPEKWPLIQSYALESHDNGAGVRSSGSDTVTKGFFTMNHEVVNVSCALRDVMAQLDTFSAKRVVLEVVPLLQYHYMQFLMKLDHAESPEARTAKSETEIGEDLLSFYEFGTMQYASRGLEILPMRGSRVLFGKRTSDLATKSSGSVYLADTGVTRAFGATHMLVQVEDPFSGVRFVRTYFLSTGKVCNRIVDEDALVHPPSQQLAQHDDVLNNARDTQLLTELYVLLLRGFKAALHTLVALVDGGSERGRRSADGSMSLQKSITEAKAAATRAMIEQSRAHSHVLQKSELPSSFLDENLSLHAECLDTRGLSTELRADGMNLLYVSMTLANVPSQVESSELLGSLVVGDSLLLRALHSLEASSELERSRVSSTSTASQRRDAFICVTKAFPYFRSWIHGGQEADFVRALVATLRSDFMLQSPAIQLGHAVATMDALADAPNPTTAMSSEQDRDTQATAQVALAKAVLLLDCEELPSVDGTMRLFSGGFVFMTPHMNPVLISLAKHVSSFQVVASQFDELVLLRIDLKTDAHTSATPLSESLPFSFASHEVYIPLLSGSRFQEEILRVLATWKGTAEELEIPFYRPHDLRLAFEGDTPRDGRTASAASSELSSVIRDTCTALVKRQRTLLLENSVEAVEAFFPTWFIPKDSNPVTTLGKPSQDLRKLCVPITAMVGIPGSDVVRIAQLVCDISSNANDWMHVVVDARDAPPPVAAKKSTGYEQYTYEQICCKLVKTLELIKANMNPRVHPRIMLVVVGYVDSITVAAAIKHVALSASPAAPLPVKLSLLAACVSATNVYLPDPLAAQSPFPKLFDQMTAGFATHIVVTHSSDVSASQLGRLRFHIDHANPYADIQVLSQDVFEGPITALLAIDRFESAYYVRYRDTHFPRWCSDDSTAWKQHVAELDAKQMPESLRFEIAPGMERSRFLHLVGSTLTPFAAFAASLDKHTKGIRIAQALAVDKIPGAASGNSSAGAEYGVCWGVEARVVFTSEPRCVYHYVSTGLSARMRVESTLTQQISDAGNDASHSATQQPSLEVSITGMDLNAAKVHDLLLNCYAQVECSVAPLRSKASVSIEEKREIQKAHAMDPLPEGYLFDGSNYVDFFGGRYEFHPNIAQFIDEHIAAANEMIKRTNSKAEESRHAQQTFVKQIV